MPRILYLINSFNSGGAERGILSLIDTGFFEGTHLELVAIHKGEVTILEELEKRNWQGSVHYCTPHQHLSVTAMLKTAWYILGRILKTRPQFLMLSLTQSNLIGRFLAVLFPKLKVISFEHNTGFSKKMYGSLLKLLSWRVQYCLYDDPLTYKVAKQNFYFKKTKHLAFYTPLHAIAENIVKKVGYNLKKPVKILSVGRLNAQKNYAEAIKAVALLKKRDLTVQLSIAGTGEEQQMLESLAMAQGVAKQINFLGFVNNWAGLATESDIFLLSSTREGMSIVTVEAMAIGMPIVATNVGGIQEYGKDGANMIKAANPQAVDIANALAKVIADDALRADIGKQAAIDAYATFGASKVNATIATARQKIFFSF